MAKPWAKLELGYLSHPKFLALTANAICLWHEGKNYCDSHHTDGFVPAAALQTFRFRGKRSVSLLLQSCGSKPDGTPYAALWGPESAGYRMHDYLQHNDSRKAVLTRLEQSERDRALDRAYKARARTMKKVKQEARPVNVRTGHEPDCPVDSPVDVRLYTESESESEQERTTPAGGKPSHAPWRPAWAPKGGA